MTIRWTLRAAAAVATGWLVVTALPGGTGGIGVRAPGGVVHAAGQDCGCPPMPVVATSKNPAKGQVKYEMTVAQIERLFSNRHAMFAGGWDDGFVALAHDIDPSGALKIWDRPRPAANPRISLEEGTFTVQVLSPPSGGGLSARTETSLLLHTLARINKYGEPEQGLREAALAALRFLTDDLANITPDATRGNAKALYLRAVAYDARGTINGYVSLARPSSLKSRLARGGPDSLVRESERADLKLDDLDLANAALDAYWAIDDQKRDHVVRLHEDDIGYIVDNLADIASARSVFGGTAVAGAAQESVACRAYSTLATFADARLAGSRPARQDLVTMVLQPDLSFNRTGQPTDWSRFNAARAALFRAGVADTAEADILVKMMVFKGTPTSPINGATNNDLARDAAHNALSLELVTTLRALPLYMGGDRDTFRDYMAGKISEHIEILKRRQEDGTGVYNERQFLELWKTAEARVTLVNPDPPCGPNPGDPKGRIIFYAVCADGLQVIEELYLSVPTVVEMQFDAESGKEKKEIPIELTIGAQTLKLTAHRYDDHGRIFRTDPILPAFAPDKTTPIDKKDVFDPPAPGRTYKSEPR